MQFLTCIESSLLPYGMLEPPLWSERKQKEERKINSNDDETQSSTKNKSKDQLISEKEEEKTSDAEKSIQGENASNEEEDDSKPNKKPKRIFPLFSLSRRKKEVQLFQVLCNNHFCNIQLAP